MEDRFARVRSLLKDAVRTSLSALRARFPEQTFYAFALNDAEGTGPSPTANSEERWREWLDRKKVTVSNERFLYRWSPEEWSGEGIDTEPFVPVWDLLSAEHDRWGSELRLGPDSTEWLDFKAQSFATSVAALRELSDEGFFGRAALRPTVFFSISDDADAVWLERESARWVNPPAMFAAFEPEWKLAISQQYGERPVANTELRHRFDRFLGSD